MTREDIIELDKILHEIQSDEYLNEDVLPKIGKARELINKSQQKQVVGADEAIRLCVISAKAFRDGDIWTEGLVNDFKNILKQYAQSVGRTPVNGVDKEVLKEAFEAGRKYQHSMKNQTFDEWYREFLTKQD